MSEKNLATKGREQTGKLASELVTAIVLVFIAIVVFLAVRNVLPSVLQDELVYQQDARKDGYGVFALPNYLYFRVYGLANLLGSQFYLGVKVLNLAFLLATSIFLLFWNRRRVNFWLRFFVSISYMAGPFVVFTSFYMPEPLYGFFVVVGLSLFMRAKFEEINNKVPLIAGAGFLLGMAALVKPHAMFVVLGVFVYLIFELISRKGDGRVTRQVVVFGGFFLLARTSVGFVAAGLQVFNLTGSYSDGLDITQQSSGLSWNLGSISNLLWNWALNIGQHLLVIAVFLGPIIYLVISRRVAFHGAFKFLMIVLLTVAIVLAAFESYITVFSGDDHLARVLIRHYEFLFPLIWLEALKSITEKGTETKPFSVALAQFSFALAFVVIGLTESVFWKASGFSDSGITTALASGGNWFLVGAGLLLMGLFTVSFKPSGLLVSVMSAFYFVGLGAFVTIHLSWSNSVPVPSDLLALHLSTKLNEDAKVLVVGTDKVFAEASVFSLNLANADYELFADTVLTINPAEAIGVVDYIIPIDGLKIQDIGQVFIITEWGTVSDLRNLSGK
jgi:hypothetical protein